MAARHRLGLDATQEPGEIAATFGGHQLPATKPEDETGEPPGLSVDRSGHHASALSIQA